MYLYKCEYLYICKYVYIYIYIHVFFLLITSLLFDNIFLQFQGLRFSAQTSAVCAVKTCLYVNKCV